MDKSERISNVIFIFTIISISFAFFIFSCFDLSFNAIQCLFMLLCLFIPYFFQSIFKIKVSSLMFIIFDIYLIAHFVFGEILGFYIKILHYDTFLHFSSAILLSMFGYSIIHYYLKDKYYIIQLLFAIMFGLSCEFFWEILEFLIDEFFLTNMQRFIKHAIILIGHEAIKDTIKDMIVAVFGSVSFLLLIRNKKFKDIKISKYVN